LTNTRSDRVKRVRGLARRSARLETGHRLVEGPQACREAAVDGYVSDLFVTPDAAAHHPEIVSATGAAGGYVHLAAEAYVAAISGDAQGVVAVARDPWAGAELAPHLAARSGPPRLVAVFEEVRNPGNAGAVIRAADAAGAGLVVFTEASADPTSPKVVRGSAGSYFHLPVVAGGGLEPVTAALRQAGYQVLAADGAGQVPLFGAPDGPADLTAPTAWVFGNEARGLTDRARAAADLTVRIPIFGRAESLNLAMAATLCLFASAQAQAG
jgi:TrmH family RNA methyltransferase